MNYLINTSLNAYDRFAAMIRSLFVALAKRDIEDMANELRDLTVKAQIAVIEEEKACAYRIAEINQSAKIRELELRYRIEQMRLWVGRK